MTTDEQSISLRQLSRDYHEGRINYERYQAERARILDGASGWEGNGADTAPDIFSDLTTTEPTTPRTAPARARTAPKRTTDDAVHPAPISTPTPDWRWIIGAFLLGQASMAILFLLFK